MSPTLPEDRGWMGDPRRGASMGRENTITHNGHGKLYLRKLRLVDGDYDTGGAYWGYSETGDIYWATNGGDGHLFVRAKSRDDAKARMRDLIPGLEFLR